MELERIVGGEGDEEAPGEVLGEGVAVVGEEEGVVAEGRHGYANLCQVVQVLQHRDLADNKHGSQFYYYW